MTQTGWMGLISAAPFGRGTPGRNSKIMGDLALLDKGGYWPPMPQQPRADEPDDQNHAGADQWRHADAQMAEGKTVVDRPDRLAGKERRRMHRQRGAARGLRQIRDVNLE